jgi:hypothetical protein
VATPWPPHRITFLQSNAGDYKLPRLRWILVSLRSVGCKVLLNAVVGYATPADVACIAVKEVVTTGIKRTPGQRDAGVVE